jgi:hypothetical protein
MDQSGFGSVDSLCREYEALGYMIPIKWLFYLRIPMGRHIAGTTWVRIFLENLSELMRLPNNDPKRVIPAMSPQRPLPFRRSVALVKPETREHPRMKEIYRVVIEPELTLQSNGSRNTSNPKKSLVSTRHTNVVYIAHPAPIIATLTRSVLVDILC